VNLHFVAHHAYGKRVDFDARVIAPRAILHSKSPSVPRASDDALFDTAFGQRRAHVRAKVIDGEKLIALAKDRHHAFINGERFALIA
jgi:hypothetical protein